MLFGFTVGQLGIFQPMYRLPFRHTYSVSVLLSLVASIGLSGIAVGSEDFETRIRPVLAEHCFECHGAERADGGLRLDTAAGFMAGGSRGSMLLPEVDREGLITPVLHNKAPFDHPQITLTSQAFGDLRDWIKQGAPWPEIASGVVNSDMADYVQRAKKEHWAYQPVLKPALPVTKQSDWVTSPIDAFVLARLEEAGLSPSAVAEPAALLRRIYYDLIGLPPGFEAIETFKQDHSREAIEKVIDELLAMPQYGERWGRYWLDVARYSDTRGFGDVTNQYFPFPHTYRDYVIRAFNEDVPYDQFILEQLAADQLAQGEDNRALAAMGFITLGRQFPGDRNATLDDQIDVVMRGLQGLTVSCARCHDHKFDPIPTADYYSLYGVFRSSHRPSELPLIEEPDTASPEYQAYKEELNKRKGALKEYLAQVHVELLNTTRSRTEAYLGLAYRVMKTEDHKGIKADINQLELSWETTQDWVVYLKTQGEAHDPVFGLWWALAQLEAVTFKDKAPDIIKAYLSASSVERPMSIAVKSHFINEMPATMEAVNAFYGELLNAADQEWKDLLAAYTQRVVVDAEVTFPDGLPNPEREVLRQVFYARDSPANITVAQVEGRSSYMVRRKIEERRTAIAQHISTHPSRPDRAMVLADADTPYEPYIFSRGREGNMGESVPRRFLEVLSGQERLAFTQGSGRLDLAQHIASKENPLTARIMVNRIWMHHFAQALVGTPSDFGAMGAEPTHPALLDYLASTFMEEDWSIKKLHKRIMLSSTYLQSSAETAAALAQDPDNKLYWHFARRRLDFEAMRDTLLLAADNLDTTLGGHSIDITEAPYPNRRTVYAEIDRQNLPAVFATFDFAAPTSHSAKRFETTVPQQSLYMMNNPFVAEQARKVAVTAAGAGPNSSEARIQAMYRKIFAREATVRELELGVAFVEGMSDTEPLALALPEEKNDWLYGYGTVDESSARTTTFTAFPFWSGEAYQGDGDWPEGNLGYAKLAARGGHPGDEDHAVIRRWVSPVDSTIAMVGELHHYSAMGDGIKAYVISSRAGILWSSDLQDGMTLTEFQDSPIQKGDTVDLIVTSKGEAAEDAFRWHPRLYLSAPDAAQYPKQDWLTRFDFVGPPKETPEPLGAWDQYAQVLLMSNEFIFVD